MHDKYFPEPLTVKVELSGKQLTEGDTGKGQHGKAIAQACPKWV